MSTLLFKSHKIEEESMLELVIDRRKWLRGGKSVLRTGDGKMCCLGFACIQSGLSEKDIENLTTPSKITCSFEDTFNLITDYDNNSNNIPIDSEFADQAMFINDDDSIFDTEREEELVNLFSKNNIDLKFIN